MRWLLALRRREYFIGPLAFSVVANDAPTYLTESCRRRQLVDVIVHRSERHRPQPFVPPTSRTKAYKHSPTLEAMSLLNSVNILDFSPAKLHTFRQSLFKTLIARGMADWARRVRDERLSRKLLNIPRARL